MDTAKLIDGLEAALQVVEKLAPFAEVIGGGKVAALIGTAADVAGNALERIEQGQLVVSTREKAVVVEINRALAAKNDALAAAIANS